jgi:MFS family permease
MRWWTGANLVSSAGTWMQMTVQNLLVLQITGSPAATGLSLAVQAAPGLLFGVAGGAVVDRWPRKAVVAASQALLGAIALATAVLVGIDALNLPLLLALSAVTGLVAAVDGPATSLLGNDMVPADDVPSAIGLGSVTHSAGRLLGVGLAGGMIAVTGPAAAYLVNGGSFLAVAALVPFLRMYTRRLDDVVVPVEAIPQVEAVEPADPAGPRASARDGIRFFRSRPRLVALLAVTAVSAIFGRNYSLTLAVLVTGALAGTTEDFATVAAVLAVGGIVGAFFAGRLRRPSVRIVALLAAAGALLQVLAGLSPTFALLLVVVAPMAVVESLSDTAGATVLQTDPPAAMRGRVLGVWRSASTAWGLAGPPLLGLMMELIGVRGALVTGGAVVLMTIAAGMIRNVYTARSMHTRSSRSSHESTTAKPSRSYRPIAPTRHVQTESAIVLTPLSSARVSAAPISLEAMPWPRSSGSVQTRLISARPATGAVRTRQPADRAPQRATRTTSPEKAARGSTISVR